MSDTRDATQTQDRTAADFASQFHKIVANIEVVIRGKTEVVERALVCLIAEGHLLVEDVPGVGKTSLAKALATSIECSFGRLQFTPDVLPTDVTGVNIWNRSSGEFEFQPGPVFANIVLGDEINRASPKTQAALLEAMEERQVTIDGVSHQLGRPFMVVATQNPIEHEGTYPLPESQLDRFLMRISVGYPSAGAALEILDTHGTSDNMSLGPVVSLAGVKAMVQTAQRVHVAPSLKRYIVDIAEATRKHSSLTLGVSPRATLSLQSAARAQAAARGRAFVTPDDIKELTVPVLAHRLLLAPEAQLQGTSVAKVIANIVGTIAVPTTSGA